MAINQPSDNTVSPARIRLGLLFFVIWWIPLYLAVPGLTRALGVQGNHHATVVITGLLLLVQSAIGLIGLWLLGKQLALTLKRVSFRKLPVVIWRIVWSGRTTIDSADLKPAKSPDKHVGQK